MLITQIFVLGGNRTHDLWLSSQGLEPLDQQAEWEMEGGWGAIVKNSIPKRQLYFISKHPYPYSVTTVPSHNTKQNYTHERTIVTKLNELLIPLFQGRRVQHGLCWCMLVRVGVYVGACRCRRTTTSGLDVRIVSWVADCYSLLVTGQWKGWRRSLLSGVHVYLCKILCMYGNLFSYRWKK